VEKELLVLVTPHLVQPLEADEVMPLPGDAVEDPTDCEFFLLNQFEGQTGMQHRSTVEHWRHHRNQVIHYEKRHISGPIGFGH
jgi:Flp pilus assembly secretin CpaC